MAASFPFVDPIARIENVLWSLFHCRRDHNVAARITNLWQIWSLHPAQQQQIVASRTVLLKVVVLRVLQALRNHSSSLSDLLLDGLMTMLQLLHSVVNQSITLQQFTKQLGASGDIERVQQRFSEFTSGWRLCIELVESLSHPLVASQEFYVDGLHLRALEDRLGSLSEGDDGTRSVVSVVTTHSVAPSKYSAAGYKIKRAHYQSAIAKDAIQEDGSVAKNEKFKLETLEEHRYATRFQEKRVTPKTWRSALREAHKLIRSEDRGNVAEALYLLLEIIWLDPPGSNLATLYLDAGSIYLAFDHLDEAAKAYRNSLRLDASNWKAHFNLGVALARLEDFVEATRQLKLALMSCPDDIATEIATMLEEISQIQYSKNLRMFNETRKARDFTTQYLESLHQVSGTPKKYLVANTLQEDHTLSHRNGLALASATPQLLDVCQGWKGSLASLLHRMYACASIRRLNIQDEVLRDDPARIGGLSVQAFSRVVARITGTALRVSEHKELTRIVGNNGTIAFHFLAPNAESTSTINEMQHNGACHSLLEWSLFLKRAHRSPNSKAGGLWYWFEATMEKWVEQVLPQIASEKCTISSLVKALIEREWLTPMDFAWNWRCLPRPDDLLMLQLADRGIFIYECHCVRKQVQDEARCTLQMFARRVLFSLKGQRTNAVHRGRQNVQSRRALGTLSMENVQNRLAKDSKFYQQVSQDVLQCIDDMVDDLVVRIRCEQHSYEDEVEWQEIPVRTEQRQKVIHAMAVVHTP